MERRGIAAATIVIMLGTLTTSVLGFVRAFVVARVFGAHTDTDAFFAALIVPQILYSGLIGGAVSAVLIPTFHPAFLLRNPGEEYKRMAWEDLQLARREYDRRRTR